MLHALTVARQAVLYDHDYTYPVPPHRLPGRSTAIAWALTRRTHMLAHTPVTGRQASRTYPLAHAAQVLDADGLPLQRRRAGQLGGLRQGQLKTK